MFYSIDSQSVYETGEHALSSNLLILFERYGRTG